MNSKIKKRLHMLKVVQSVCNDANAAITSINALNNAYTRLKSKIGEIDIAAQEQVLDIRGRKNEKDNIKKKLALVAGKIAVAVMTYAHDSEDIVLKKEVGYTDKKLNSLSDDLIIKFSKNIFDKATPVIAGLADYGIDPAMLTTLESLLTDFEKASPKVKEARSRKKMYTANLEKLIKEAIEILKNDIDHLVKILDGNYANFVTLYKNARSIDDYHGRKQKEEPLPSPGA